MFSIIIPCYNQTEYLNDAILSVINQTEKDWEIVVVDDFSTDSDDITQIIDRFKTFPIKILRHEKNLGLAASRNTGVRNSAGDIIVPLDADDKLTENYLTELKKAFIDQKTDLVYFNLSYFGKVCDRERISITFDEKTFVTGWQFIPGIAPIRRRVWESIGGWCESEIFKTSDEDYDFLLSVVEKELKCIYLNKSLYCYRIHGNSMTSKPRLNSKEIYRSLYYRHKKLILKHSSYSEWIARARIEFINSNLKIYKYHLAVKEIFILVLCNKKFLKYGINQILKIASLIISPNNLDNKKR